MDDALAHQLEMTALLVEHRLAEGDDATVVRSVDHAVKLRGKQVEAFCVDAERAGFSVRNRRRGLLRTTVELDRDDAVDAGSAAAFTREVVGLAAAHGGEYDGWGALVLPVDREPDLPRPDGVALAEVDVDAEQSRLREVYAARLVETGCPRDLAVRHAEGDVSLWTQPGPGTWAVVVGPTSFGRRAQYSPSLADETVQEAADEKVDENRRRRKPWWTPAGP